MDFSAHVPGSVCWLDLGVTDPDAAGTFYSQLFGWTVARPDDSGYRLASLHGHPVAALGPAEDPGPPYWTSYVSVRDIQASATAVAAAGGTIVVPPASAGDVGEFAVVREPTGAPLSLWQPGSHPGTYASGEHGTFAQAQLRSDHPELAGDFLNAVLNWQPQPDGTITCDGRTVATWLPAPEPGRPRQRSQWLLSFAVSSVTAATDRARELGARRSIDQPNVLVDPVGATFGLLPATC